MTHPLYISPGAEAWIEFADETMISIFDQDGNSQIRISVWAPDGKCLHTYCISRKTADYS